MTRTGTPEPRHEPPRVADRLLEWFVAPHLLEALQGDLHEEFAYQVDLIGTRRARWRYWRDVLGFVRPFAIRRKQADYPYLNFTDMLRNYVKIAFRHLWKSKEYATINVVGLGAAFCISVFLFLTAYLQLTYDSFHEDADRIFKVYSFANDPEQPTKTGAMPLPLQPALKAEFPELEAVTRVLTIKNSAEYDGKYLDKIVTAVDPDFLTLFSFPLIKGTRETALSELSSVVLSERMAENIFGRSEPMGKHIRIHSNGQPKEYIVTGIAREAPTNSTIHFDALIRIENLPAYAGSKANWSDNSYPVFVKTAANVDQSALEERFKAFTAKYFPDRQKELKSKGARPDSCGDVFALRLDKLTDIHFDRKSADQKGTPVAVVYVLLGMVAFILLIACINFINLSIARSFKRAREVGVRKSLGALRGELFVQIWGESTLICFFGFALGALLAYLFLPAFNAVFGAKLDLAYALQPGFIGLIIGLFILVTLLAGGYPAWQMAKLNTVEVLKGKVSMKRPGVLRNALIVTQFSLSSLLICCTVVAMQQVNHLQRSPVGFDTEQIISIPVGEQVNGRQVLQRLRNRLANDPAVLTITGAGVNLGRGKDRVMSRSVLGFTYKGRQVSTDMLLVDYDYFKTLNINMLAGRDFSPAYPADSANRIIVTESMAKLIGEKNLVGTLLGDDSDTTGTKSQIIGVVSDFQLYSVADKARPITIHLSATEPIRYVFVRVAPNDLMRSMDRIKQVWREVAPQSEFMGSFLNENVAEWYQNETQLSQIFSLAAGIAILLSFIGLFAVAILVIEQRTKEIGIRKILGSSIFGIVLLLSRDFVKLVLIALAIALPLAGFGLQQWLNNYAVRIELSGWVFAGVGLAAILIALLSVSFQTVKAALANPVKSLRSE
ncbi:ABC transporter permease [Nibrella saemangeumensis]|uniref:ABC transporter permease n=1 Tax=Nibrella saemangeumensis TaxID=1084526 RepID=A0ABP8MFY6_9BACT